MSRRRTDGRNNSWSLVFSSRLISSRRRGCEERMARGTKGREESGGGFVATRRRRNATTATSRGSWAAVVHAHIYKHTNTHSRAFQCRIPASTCIRRSSSHPARVARCNCPRRCAPDACPARPDPRGFSSGRSERDSREPASTTGKGKILRASTSRSDL